MITDFSPQFGGFQIGPTYMPSVTGNDGEGSLPSSCRTTTSAITAHRPAVNSSRSFNGIDVEAGAGISKSKSPTRIITRTDFVHDLQSRCRGRLRRLHHWWIVWAVNNSEGTRRPRLGFRLASYEVRQPWMRASAQVILTDSKAGSGQRRRRDCHLRRSGRWYALGPGIKTDFTVIYAIMTPKAAATTATAVSVPSSAKSSADEDTQLTPARTTGHPIISMKATFGAIYIIRDPRDVAPSAGSLRRPHPGRR